MHNSKFCTVRDDSKGTTDVVIYHGEVKVGDLVVCNYGSYYYSFVRIRYVILFKLYYFPY